MRTSLALLLVALGCFDLKAQSLPAGRKDQFYVMTENGILGSLELDTVQRARLEAVERAYEKDLDALMNADTLDDAAMKAKGERLAQERQDRFKEILSPAQYAQWTNMTNEAKTQ